MTGRNSSRDETEDRPGGPCQWCGKVSWRTRKAAKKIAKQRTGTVAYACQLAPDYAGDVWHTGHPPAQLKAGTIARDEVRSTSTRRRTLRP